MKKFNFSYDQKCTVWYRPEIEVEAETQEDANIIAIGKIISGEIDEVPWGIIDDTIETMSVQDNGGQQTAELLTYPNQDMIWTNIRETNG